MLNTLNLIIIFWSENVLVLRIHTLEYLGMRGHDVRDLLSIGSPNKYK